MRNCGPEAAALAQARHPPKRYYDKTGQSNSNGHIAPLFQNGAKSRFEMYFVFPALKVPGVPPNIRLESRLCNKEV